MTQSSKAVSIDKGWTYNGRYGRVLLGSFRVLIYSCGRPVVSHPSFSHAWHIDVVDVHWCLSCLHGLALRSLGSWLGDPGFRLCDFFALAPTTDGLLGTWHTSFLVTPLFTAACYDASIPLVFLLCLVLVVVCLLAFCGLCGFLFCCLWLLVGLFLKPVERYDTA